MNFKIDMQISRLTCKFQVDMQIVISGLQLSAPCIEQLIKVDMRMKVFDVAPQEASFAS